MKKISLIVLALILAFTATVCAAEAVGMENPRTEYSSLTEINDILDCTINEPIEFKYPVENEKFAIIKTGGQFDIGEYSFTVGSDELTLRFCADYENDYSGVLIDGKPAFEGRVTETEYAQGEGIRVARWANVDGQYSLCVKYTGEMTDFNFGGIVAAAMLATTPEESGI